MSAKPKPRAAILTDNRKLFVLYVGGKISRQDFTDLLTKSGAGWMARDRLLKSADKLRKLTVRHA